MRHAPVGTPDEAIEILSVAGEGHLRCAGLKKDANWAGRGTSRRHHTPLAAFGGTGSFNDLVLSPHNSHRGDAETLRLADKRMCGLRDTIWTASKLLERSGSA